MSNPYFPDDVINEIVQQHGSPLLILDENLLRDHYSFLEQALPGVEFYYAVKAFPHNGVINILKNCGAGFDIASSGEIDLVSGCDVNAKKTIHTHPIKKDSDIRDALRYGCTTFVVDNEEELKKFIPYKSRVGLLLRVCFRNPDAVVDLSKKFGCHVDNVPAILQQARQMSISVKGLSFHVGSQCSTPDYHVHALRQCSELIDRWEALSGTPMSIIDIGGGFPVDYRGLEFNTRESIATFCKPIMAAIRELPENLTIIAEPGRYLSSPAVISVSQVVGKAIRGEHIWYYLDDGVYNSFSGKIFDHADYPIKILGAGGEEKLSVLAGPTCDSIDVIEESILLPELQIGDILVSEMKGAYTYATATEFNSLPKTKVVII